jgi:hypothetical protein
MRMRQIEPEGVEAPLRIDFIRESSQAQSSKKLERYRQP